VVGVDKDQAWQVIHQERAALAEILETLSPAEWEHPSLCEGWTVRDVAAHVIGGPQIKIGQMLAATVRTRGSIDRAIRDTARQWSLRPTTEIVADFHRYSGTRRPAPMTTHRDALLDILVHTQDIVIPLERDHEMPLSAAQDSAEHALRLPIPFHAKKRLSGYRLEGTDTDWSTGEGLLVRGPISALLLLITGRPASLSRLTGDGVPRLQAQMGVTS
jgi:uncharacterized protein (TIGR03083 family)